MNTAILVTLIAAVIGYAVMAYRKPSWGLAALIILLPLERIGSFALNPSAGRPLVRLSQVVGAGLILAIAAKLLQGNAGLRRIPGGTLLLFLALSALLSVGLISRSELWLPYISFIFVLALTYTVVQLTTRDLLPILRKVLLGSALVVTLFGLYQYFGDLAGLSTAWTGLREAYTKVIFGFPRVHSTALEPLYYANYLLLPGLLGLAWLVSEKIRSKRFWVALGLILINLGLTVSRGGFIGLSLGLITLAYLLWPELKSQRWAGLLRLVLTLAASVIAVIALISFGSYVTRGTFSQGPKILGELNSGAIVQTGSYTERADLRKTALDIWNTHPWFGVGIGGIAPYLHDYPAHPTADDRVSLNSQSLELLAEGGIVGFLAYYGFVAYLLWVAWRQLLRLPQGSALRVWLAGLVAVVVAMHIQAQSFSGFYLTHIWVTLGLLAGLVASAKEAK